MKLFEDRIGQHASKCTAEQHSFGMSEAERNRRIQEEAKRNALNVDIGIFLIIKINIAICRIWCIDGSVAWCMSLRIMAWVLGLCRCISL